MAAAPSSSCCSLVATTPRSAKAVELYKGLPRLAGALPVHCGGERAMPKGLSQNGCGHGDSSVAVVVVSVRKLRGRSGR